MKPPKLKSIIVAIILIAICGSALVAGYTVQDISHIDSGRLLDFTESKITRIHDDELNATCWISQSRFGEGLSCVSDYDLKQYDREVHNESITTNCSIQNH
jgi:hypothetical protein